MIADLFELQPPDTFELSVEQRHIDNGMAHDGDHCPIALAALDQGLRVPRMHVAIGLSFYVPVPGGFQRIYYHSRPAGEWAKRFDLNRHVRPRTFVFKRASAPPAPKVPPPVLNDEKMIPPPPKRPRTP